MDTTPLLDADMLAAIWFVSVMLGVAFGWWWRGKHEKWEKEYDETDSRER